MFYGIDGMGIISPLIGRPGGHALAQPVISPIQKTVEAASTPGIEMRVPESSVAISVPARQVQTTTRETVEYVAPPAVSAPAPVQRAPIEELPLPPGAPPPPPPVSGGIPTEYILIGAGILLLALVLKK